MEKEEILSASKKEHKNKDLAEIEVKYHAGSHASRVGAYPLHRLGSVLPTLKDNLNIIGVSFERQIILP